MAVAAVRQNGRVTPATTYTEPWKKRIQTAKQHRAPLEEKWKENLAFAAGRFYAEYSRSQRRMVTPARATASDRYVVDELTRYRMTALGEASSDDFQPNLLFATEDEQAQAFQAQANRALAFAWDNEINADDKLTRLLLILIDLGTAAIRCRYDRTVGETLAKDVPHKNGQPILNQEDARSYVADQTARGQSAQLTSIKAGKLTWETLTPFNLLIPPGVVDPAEFPWEIIVRPVHTSVLRSTYGDKAASLAPDDLASLASTTSDTNQFAGASEGKIEEHVQVYTCYDRTTQKKSVLAGADLTPLEIDQPFDYQGPDGTKRTGITYFRYFPLADRFWGRGLTEVGVGPTRIINKRIRQHDKTIDGGQPYLLVEKGSELPERKGFPLEIVQVAKGQTAPQAVSGVNPGPWIRDAIEMGREDLERAMGISAASVGQDTQTFDNYSALALAAEKDAVKRIPLTKAFKTGVAHVVEDTLYDMRRYWPPDKEILIAGDNDRLDAETFDASKIPSFFMVRVAKGGSKPRTQGAEIQKIRDIWQAALDSQQPLPASWLAESYEAGKALPMPEDPTDVHAENARWENEQMSQGQQLGVLYFDPAEVHVPIHREAQIRAKLEQRWDILNLIEEHVLEHLQVAARAQASLPPPVDPNQQAAEAQQAQQPPDISPVAQALQAQQQAQAHDQQQSQQQDLHVHAVRKASAEADLAEKKAAESSFKPQPKPGG